ncbi:MAG: class I adenylate-forming enzyme family protein [Gammaproteobacteria bacterium]
MNAVNTLLTLHDPDTARRYYESGVWRADTFYTLAAGHAARSPHRPAVRDASRRIGYGELVTWADALAEDLHRSGVRRGMRISIWLANCVEAVAILLACSRNGYVCNTSLHQQYTVADILRLLERMRTAALFVQPGYGARSQGVVLESALAGVESLRKIYSFETPVDECGPRPGFPALIPATTEADCSADKVMYLAFTSGTTGDPKGVMHSDNTLLANARAMVEDWRHGPHTVLYSLSPLSHHIGTVAVAQALVAGAELVVNDLTGGATALQRIVETGATYVMGVPTHAMDILAEQRKRKLDRLGEVRVFYMAGAPIPPEVARAFQRQGIVPQNIYGMTENSSHQYTLPDDDAQTIVNTCGRACRAYEVRTFDADNADRPAPPGQVGEIGGRGGCLMLGYFDNQAATEQSFNATGWFMSGDLGLLDERGCLRVMGRKKDLIIRGGHNIYPAEIEALAVNHPHVDKAAAIPVPDTRLGEKVCLAVTKAGSTPPGPDEVLPFLAREGLSKYDMPEYFIVMPELPLTASGKILKRRLIEMLRNGEIEPLPVRWQAPA